MKLFSKLGAAIVAFVAVFGFVACASTTSGNKALSQKSEFELKDAVVVGKTTKRQVYELLGEPSKNFGIIDAEMIAKGARFGDYKVSNPKTRGLIMYAYSAKESGGAKNLIPVVSDYMSKDTSTTEKVFYVGFDDNDIVTERWYSTQRTDSSETNIDNPVPINQILQQQLNKR